jgi:prephenate dehydrogenase
MTLTKVLLVGATGETGGSIANGLLEAGNFVSLPSSVLQQQKKKHLSLLT